MGMLKEFKDFALRGNLVDMAVAFVMGAAFGKLVSSFINDIFMPLVGLITAGKDFSQLKWVLREAVMANGEVVKPEVAIYYGKFINVTIEFILIAFVMFLLVKGINNLRKKKEQEAAAKPPQPSKEEQLLTEIRDLLKAKV